MCRGHPLATRSGKGMFPMVSVRRLICALVLVLMVSQIFEAGADIERSGSRGEAGGYFDGTRIYDRTGTRALSGGLGVGDPDDDLTNEAVFCDFDGNVVLLEPDGDRFRAMDIWQEEGVLGTSRGLLDLLLSDVLPDNEGIEIITAGHSGNITAIYNDGQEWSSEVLFRSPIRIFDLDVGDVDPAEGDEILYGSMLNDQVDPDNMLRYIYRTLSGTWAQVEIPTPDSVKAIDVGDADPEVPGVEIWVTTSGWTEDNTPESSLIEIYRSGTVWTYETVFTNPSNLIANVAVGEIWSQHTGNEVLITELSGYCRMICERDGSFDVSDIFQAKTGAGEPSALEGLAIGDFNPLHPGDEGMVTGYYNEVTQIIEVDGKVVADLAWSTETVDAKLEISGVEVADLSPDDPGNEVLIASLEGWVEMLSFQEDGLLVHVPEGIYVEEGSSVDLEVRVSPKGMVSGPLTMNLSSHEGLIIVVPDGLTVENGKELLFSLEISAIETGLGTRDIELSVRASVAGQTAVDNTTVTIGAGSSDISLIIDPPGGIIYDVSGKVLMSKISISGAEGYDYLDLTSTDVDGLTVSLDTPIRPGEEKSIIITPVENVTLGQKTIFVTAHFNGAPVAQAAVLITVVALGSAFDARVYPLGEDGRFMVEVFFNGTIAVENIEFEVLLEGTLIERRMIDSLAPRSVVKVPFSVKDGDEASLVVVCKGIGDEIIMEKDLGEVSNPVDEDEGSVIWLIVAGAFLLTMLFVVTLIFFKYKPAQDEGDDLQSIGGARRYNIPQKGAGRKITKGPNRPQRPERGQQRDRDRRSRPVPWEREDRENGPRRPGMVRRYR